MQPGSPIIQLATPTVEPQPPNSLRTLELSPWSLLQPIREYSSISVFTTQPFSSYRLEAAIFYIYTGNVCFLPLRSRGAMNREGAKARHVIDHPKVPTCSCKSIYRFADEIGLNELKQRAEEELFSQLDADNTLDELFSQFSARYPKILRLQISRLVQDYWTPSAKAALEPKIQSVVRGEMPHAAPVLMMLLQEIPVIPLVA
ncbi:uncharacterized protein PHACADRAFT_106311, partial [Phanerochaete carnosa HHB-10118-sp]